MSHEFWIEPQQYQVETGGRIVADFVNGENFKGNALAYFASRTQRHEVHVAGQVTAIEGRMGDVPAIDLPAVQDGLARLVHVTAPGSIKYKAWEKFQAFADHKDFPNVAARQAARGLPEVDFWEDYIRYAKALVAVGSGAGQDTTTNLEIEFVALANPYTDDLGGGLPVLLLYQGAPRGDAQIEVFDRGAKGEVTVTLQRTDDQGRARIPVTPGHSYLLDAVVLRPAPAGERSVWETLWAALSFAVPK